MKKKIKTLILWALCLTLIFILCHALATLQRGYEAIGGEIFVFTIPVSGFFSKADRNNKKKTK